MERMIVNLKREIKMLRDKLLSTGVILEPSSNINDDDSILENTHNQENSNAYNQSISSFPAASTNFSSIINGPNET